MASVPDARPFETQELADLFRPLEMSRGLVVAVSGGSDSTALLYLIARWRAEGRAGLPVLVATVDHGLRSGAADEARAVADMTASLGLPHRTLVWQGDKPTSNLQDAARTARYRLLTEAAHDFGADTIVTAHTEDDQAETFLLALQRGSGVYGLGGMRPMRSLGDLRIARPLLTVSRARLRAMLVAEGAQWFDDPSNDNARFARVKLRQNRAALDALGLTISGLAATATRMARAADALDGAVDALIARSSGVFLGGMILVDPVVLLDAPDEIRLRAFARLLGALSGLSYVPRFDRLERLAEAIGASVRAGEALQRTLSGVTVRLDRGRLLFFREAGRAGFPDVVIGPGETIEWDRRIRVTLSQATQPLQLRAIGPGARGILADDARAKVFPATALATLPVLVDAGAEIVAIFGLEPANNAAGFGFGAVTSLVAERLRYGAAPSAENEDDTGT